MYQREYADRSGSNEWPLLVPRGRFWFPSLGSGPGGPGRPRPFPSAAQNSQPQGWARGGEWSAHWQRGLSWHPSLLFLINLKLTQGSDGSASLPPAKLPPHAQGAPTPNKNSCGHKQLFASLHWLWVWPPALPSGRREVRWGAAGEQQEWWRE